MKNSLWNMLTNIKNGQIMKKHFIHQPRKKICEAILTVLWDEGFIIGYETQETTLKIYLKYNSDDKPTINSIKHLSKPSNRIYYSIKQIWKIDSNKNFIVFSTIQGIKSISYCKKNKIGGEPLFLIN